MNVDEKYLEQLMIVQREIAIAQILYEQYRKDLTKRPAAIASVYTSEIKLAALKRDLITDAS